MTRRAHRASSPAQVLTSARKSATRVRRAGNETRARIPGFVPEEQAAVLPELRAFDYPGDRNPVRIYLTRLGTARSRTTMAAAFKRLADLASGGRLGPEELPWHQIDYRAAAAVREALADRYAPATANLRLQALRSALKEAWRLGFMRTDELAMALDLPRVRGSTPPSGRALEHGELESVFNACRRDGSLAGARDLALLAMLYPCGLRRAEASALNLADWSPEDRALRVSGKGRRARDVPVGEGVPAVLELWLHRRGRHAGPLFPRLKVSGALRAERLSGHGIYRVCARRAAEAGVRPFTPHDLRRSTATDLLTAGADVKAVADFLGHANLATTGRYDRRGARATRAAASLVAVPPMNPAGVDSASNDGG